MKEFLYKLLHFVGITFLPSLIHGFFRNLVFDPFSSFDQKLIFQILALYSYHGDFLFFWTYFAINISISSIIGVILLKMNKDTLKQYFTNVFLFHLIIIFLFWTLAYEKKPPSTVGVSIPSNYWNINLLHLGSILLLALFFYTLKIQFQSRFDSSQKYVNLQFYCPKCGYLYQSNVHYCIICQKEIIPRSKLSEKSNLSSNNK